MGHYILHKAKFLKAKSKKSLVSYYKERPADLDPYWKSKTTNRIQLEVDRLHREFKRGCIHKTDFLEAMYSLIEELLGFTIHTENNYTQLLAWVASLEKAKISMWIEQLNQLLEEWADCDKSIEVERYRNVIRLQKLLRSQLGK